MATERDKAGTPEAAVASPCIGVCELDPASGFCRGCLRTGEEIAAWRDADDEMRGEILARVAARRAGGFVALAKRQPLRE